MKKSAVSSLIGDHSYSIFSPDEKQRLRSEGEAHINKDEKEQNGGKDQDEPHGEEENDNDQYSSPQRKKKLLKVKRAVGKKKTSKVTNTNKENSRKQKVQVDTSKSNRTGGFGGKKKKEDSDMTKINDLQRFGTNRVTRSDRKKDSKEKKDKDSPRVTSKRRHCLGPGCVNAARNNSKYCSNECGVQLQIRRLQVILPTRGKKCSQDYHANKLAEDKIQKCRGTQQSCKDTLLQLDNEYKTLEELLEKSRGLTVVEEDENEEERDTDLDLTTYCVSCGIPLAPRIAFRHMEKCWAKLECLMSFGALMKSAGDLFCDTYMSQQGTYCKRLKIMCPEHYKERKIDPNEVCGCPLVDDGHQETGKFCRTARKKCTRHMAWERLRKGEIDLKRVHQWWKLEEAYEQERQLCIEMGRRNNVLGVLFNETIDHTYFKQQASPLQKHNEQQNQQMQEERSQKQERDTKTQQEHHEQENHHQEEDNKNYFKEHQLRQNSSREPITEQREQLSPQHRNNPTVGDCQSIIDHNYGQIATNVENN